MVKRIRKPGGKGRAGGDARGQLPPSVHAGVLLLYVAALLYLVMGGTSWSARKGESSRGPKVQALVDEDYQTAADERLPVH